MRGILKKIAFTFQTSLVNAVINLLTVWLTVRFLGASGQGIISLFLINISVIQIFASIIGGSALIYLTPRYGVNRVLLPSVLWSIFSSVSVSLIMSSLSLINAHFLLHTIILSLLQSLILNNSQILIAKDSIRVYNLCRLLQPLLVMLLFLIQLFLSSDHSIGLFFNALYVSYTSTFLLSSYLAVRGEHFKGFRFSYKLLKVFFHIGGFSQMNNILQLANYRFTFYIIDNILGPKSLGIFSLGISLTEAIWMLGRSISTIHHGQVSRHKESGIKNNKRLIRLSFFGTSLITIAALLIPAEVYALIFGSEFRNIKEIIFLLSPGITAIASAMVISYYFSAVKRLHLNTISSAAGFLVIITASFILIPRWGILGAAVSNTLSYLTTASVIFVQYRLHLKEQRINN